MSGGVLLEQAPGVLCAEISVVAWVFSGGRRRGILDQGCWWT